MKLILSNDIEIGCLALEKRAKFGRLPEVLHVNDIVSLICSYYDNFDDRIYREALERALRSGELRSLTGAEAIDFLGKDVAIHNSAMPLPQQTSIIHRDAFSAWVKQKGDWPLPESCLLSRWWPPEKTIPSKTIRRTRINELHEVIWAAYLALEKRHSSKPTSGELWRELQRNYKKYDTEEVIDEIKKGIIYWTNFRGSEQRLKENSFKGTLCHIKKKRDISKNSN